MPAVMAGVQDRHLLAEPLPLVGAGAVRGRRDEVGGRQKSRMPRLIRLQSVAGSPRLPLLQSGA
jgi:hypothetical protein